LGHDGLARRRYSILRFSRRRPVAGGGVAQADVCAIGDNKNDEEMIAWAGLGVAMGDAPPEVQAIAGYVARTVNEAGVAEVLERFVLGKETARA